MVNINHRVGIKAPISKVYEAFRPLKVLQAGGQMIQLEFQTRWKG